MSGGHWNYQEIDPDNYKVAFFPRIVEVLSECIHLIDYDICGDTIRENSERIIYDKLKKLGDEMFDN